MSGTDWNAVAYHDLSDPQFEWGMAVLKTLELSGHERVLDAGCGSGRLTEELLRRLPTGQVVALDYSPKMLEQARQRLATWSERIEYVHASLQQFELPGKVDGVFSNAVFHWVPDHAAMFRALHRALKPGGWLVAQFGGVGNLARMLQRAREVAGQARFHEYLKDVAAGAHFEDPASTRTRMETAGFQVREAKLHTVMTRFDGRERYEAFLQTVTLRSYPLAELPQELRQEFLEELSGRTWQDEGGYVLDNVRLTVRATA